MKSIDEHHRSIKSIDEQFWLIKLIDEQFRSIKSIDEQFRSIKSIDEQFRSIKSVDAHYRSIVDDEVIQVSLTKTAIDFLPNICAIGGCSLRLFEKKLRFCWPLSKFTITHTLAPPLPAISA